jgi:hypothetical protein
MNTIQYVSLKLKTTSNKTAALKRQRMLLEMFYADKRNFILNASKPQLRLVVQNIKARCTLHFATKKNLDEVRDMNVPFGTPFCREAGLILVFVGGKTYIYFGVSKLREI